MSIVVLVGGGGGGAYNGRDPRKRRSKVTIQR